MSGRGYVLVHRQIRGHWIYEPSRPRTMNEAWQDLVMRAHHDNVRVLWQGQRINLGRGEFVTSERHLADAWKWSRGRVRRFLAKLEAEVDAAGRPDPMVDRRSAHQGIVVTICKYDDYQVPPTTKRTTKRTTDGPPTGEFGPRNAPNSVPPIGPPTGPPSGGRKPPPRGPSLESEEPERTTERTTDRPTDGPPTDHQTAENGPRGIHPEYTQEYTSSRIGSLRAGAREVMTYWNDLAGQGRHPEGVDGEYLRERLVEGYTVSECCRVVDAAIAQGYDSPRAAFSRHNVGDLLAFRGDRRWHDPKIQAAYDAALERAAAKYPDEEIDEDDEGPAERTA